MSGLTTKGKSRKAAKPSVRGLTVPQHDYARWHLIAVLIIAALLVSNGLALVRAAQAMRSLHSELDQLQTHQHSLMAEYSRLLLERSSFASLQTVETVATQELRMQFPQTIEEVVR